MSKPGTEINASIKTLIQSGQLAQAESLCREQLTGEPDDTGLLYLHAVCLRYLQRQDEALKPLTRLQQLDPDYARAWQESGHNLRQLGDNPGALTAYEKAVSLNPALQASWQAMAQLYQEAGRLAEAEHTSAQFRRLQELPAELRSVSSMINEGRLYRAEALCRSYLQQHPTDVEGMRMLARLGIRHHVLDDAQFLLESGLDFEPGNQEARMDYIEVLHRRQKYREALEQARQLHTSAPEHAHFNMLLANQAFAAGEYDDALSLYKKLVRNTRDWPALQLAYGHALKTVGRTDDAINAYHAACNSKVDFGDAWWSLANLKTYRFDDNELHAMQNAEGAPETRLDDRIHLCFALGKAYEDRGEYRPSFDHYNRGNHLHMENSRYSADSTRETVDAQIKYCDASLFERRQDQGCPASDPVFIVGMPRAGSTLLEQILSSHSQVEGTMELHNILALAHRLGGRRRVDEEPRYPANMHELEAGQLYQFGTDFIENTRFLRHGGRYFIDKMPNNFMHIGLIHLILPNARIIDARRDPMACCFSNFKQLYGEGQEFSYGLEEAGRYYLDYIRLMQHWDKVIPEKILRVQYEDVVNDLESQVYRMLEFLELPFEPQCLEFYRTARAIRTPSSEQVRQPINPAGLEQWKHYEPWLRPLKQTLASLSGK